ncbi:hypothetical protein Gotur_004770 [Gossypium turneri]
MGWLDSTEVERIRYARAYIFEMIGGYLMLDLSRNLIHLRWLLKLVNFRAGRCHQIKPKSEVAYHYYNHEFGFAFHFYVLE